MEEWTLNWTRLTPIEDASSMPNNLSGVYRLSYKHEDGNYYVFYVGQAEDIKTRLSQHKGSSETNPRLKAYLDTKKCFFKYAQITNKDVRNAIEKQAYKYYQPEANASMPQGRDDIKGNLN